MNKDVILKILEGSQSIHHFSEEIVINSEIFSENLKKLIKVYCKNSTLYFFYMNYYNNALNEARKNNLKLAERNIKKAKSNVDFTDFGKDEINIFNLLAFTVDAYMLYKKDDFRGSIMKTIEVMELDNIYEKQFSFIYFHKIQQLHNISRVYLKCNEFKKFTHTIDILLQNLLLNRSVNFENQTFESKDVNFYLDLRILMTYQVFFEVIHFIEKNTENERLHFNECFKAIIDNTDEFIFDELIGVFQWVAIKNDLLNGKVLSEVLISNYFESSKKFSDKTPTASIIRSLNTNLVQQD
ncbi:hypothetical protein SAMN04488062_10232 [Flavobacterium omnivorum]|uniref:Uncharacterized protein n=1 Tax=Flavobacterium omnivorum TaxID=178355 RepID=A0A1G7WU98_9FLAO|nr:hypothetical protein [Flavobacterium omnivorum]SDG75503.1 hypothetical protein SAMN04488062_10232 [Flavobacterium omnivorum]